MMIFKSPHPDVTIPDVSVPEFVLRHATRLGDKPAIIEATSGRTLTYAQLAADVRKLAAGLSARGFGKKDVLAIYSPNVPEYAAVLLAVNSLGGICTTANPLYTAGELAKQLDDSGARILVTVPPFLDKAREAAGKAGVKDIFVIGKADGAGSLSELMQTAGDPPAVKINPAEDLAVLPYSSGTTGLPKGVMLTHRNLVTNMRQCEGMESFESFLEHDVVLGVLPFFHIYGMVVVLQMTLAKGGTIITMPRFDMEEFLAAVAKYRISVAPLVPPIVLGLAKHPAVDNYDLSSLRIIMSGAAPLGEALAREAGARIGCKLAQGYGMTEASPVTHLTPTTNPGYKLGSLGMPVPNTEVMIADPETGKPLGRGEHGEIWIRGPQIMKGYLGRPEATAESIDADGWYHSGDIGYVDDDGYFFAVDRMKELIKYKGMQVAPAELEALLVTHPAIADAAVIPVSDEEAGELPKAYVVLRAGQSLDAESLMDFVSGQVAPHKRIRLVEFVEQIPKSASGKILRRVLIDQERARAKG
ncbi:MAG: AMP-dependent synthetase [Betaproteobacteria bacterium SG8_40]|nr:MAG: AMP-dependent synthetase [Betaproteobacteria bacterium SG8_40]